MNEPLATIPAAREWMSKNFPQADAIFTDALAIWLHQQIDEAVREHVSHLERDENWTSYLQRMDELTAALREKEQEIERLKGGGEEVKLMLESQRSQEMRKRAEAILKEHVKDDETGFGWCRAQMCYAFGMSWSCQVYEMAKLLEDALDSAMLAEHRLQKKAPNAR